MLIRRCVNSIKEMLATMEKVAMDRVRGLEVQEAEMGDRMIHLSRLLSRSFRRAAPGPLMIGSIG